MLYFKSKIKLNHFYKIFLFVIFLSSACAKKDNTLKAEAFGILKAQNIKQKELSLTDSIENFLCTNVSKNYNYIMNESNYLGVKEEHKDFFTDKKIEVALVKNLFSSFNPDNIFFSKKEVNQLKLNKKTNIITDLKNNNCDWYDQFYVLYFKNRKKVISWYDKNILSKKLNSAFKEIIKKEKIFEDTNLKWESISLKQAEKALNLSKKTIKLIKNDQYFSLVKHVILNNKDITKTFAKYPHKFYTKSVILKEAILVTKKALFVKTRNKKDIYHEYLSTAIASLDIRSSYQKPNKINREANYQKFNQGASGLGVRLKCFSTSCLIVNVMEKGASFNKIKKGDLLIAADSFYKKDLTKEDFISKILGKKGSLVNIKVLRPINSKDVEIDISITRNLITSQRIEYKILKDKTAYIKLNSFYGHSKNFNSSSQDFAQALKELGPKADSLIIDLQDNKGGGLIEAERILGYLLLSANLLPPFKQGNNIICKENLKQKQKTQYLLRDGSHIIYLAGQNPVYAMPLITYSGKINSTSLQYSCDRDTYFSAKPIVVLMNKNSASASEILALGLQSASRAVVVGSKYSYGKGSGQSYDAEKLLKLTTFLWGSPFGDSIQGVGVKSDIEINFSTADQETDPETDPEKDKSLLRTIPAVKILNSWSNSLNSWTSNEKFEKVALKNNKITKERMNLFFITPLKDKSLKRQEIKKQELKNKKVKETDDKTIKTKTDLIINEAINILQDFKQLILDKTTH